MSTGSQPSTPIGVVNCGNSLSRAVRSGAPVVAVGPVGAEVPEVGQRDALGPVVDRLRVGPAGGREAAAEVVELGIGDLDQIGLHGTAHGGQGSAGPRPLGDVPARGITEGRRRQVLPTAALHYGDPDAGLRRHRHRGRPQRTDRRGGHGPGWDAGPLRGEEPLHRGDGLDQRAGAGLPVRTGRVHPVPHSHRDLRRPRVRARAPSTSPRCSPPPSDRPNSHHCCSTATRIDWSTTSTRPSGWRRCWAWPRWPDGPRHRHAPSADSTSGGRPSRSTRCGRARPTRRNDRPSAPPCSAA